MIVLTSSVEIFPIFPCTEISHSLNHLFTVLSVILMSFATCGTIKLISTTKLVPGNIKLWHFPTICSCETMEALWIQAILIFLCHFNLSKFVRLCSEYCQFHGVIKYGSYLSLLSSAFADLLHSNDHLHFTRFQVSGKIGNRFLSTVTISLKSIRRNLNEHFGNNNVPTSN